MYRSMLFFALLACSAGVFAQSTELKAQLTKGKAVYETYCLACHQQDGAGVPSLNPPLIKTKWVLGDKPTLIRVVLDGLDEEIEIDGESYHNVMPPMTYLSDKEVADVLTYVRNSFGNKASALTEKEVKDVRAATGK